MSPSKMEIRTEVKKRILELSRKDFLFLSRELSLKLLQFLYENKCADLLGSFSPLVDEPVWHLAWDFPEWEDRLSFPKLDNGRMYFASSQLKALVPWKQKGISFKVPLSNREVVPNILIIPGRAFDRQGNRIGRGKGYYDCYLKNYKGLKIGIGFECQVFESIPFGPNDVKMDYVISEKRILKV